MKFVFTDKNSIETDIIIDILTDEHISYKVIEQRVPIIVIPFVFTELIIYDIEINTTLEQFDFVQFLLKKAIKKQKKIFKQINLLEKCYNKKGKRRSRNEEIV